MSAHKDRGSGRPDDELTRRYHEANGQDMARPGAHVRLRVQEHARAVLEAQKQAGTATTPLPAHREAANQPRWKISMLASIALAGLTGLLVLQFDRGTPQEKDLAFGQQNANKPLPAAVPAPAAATQGTEISAPPAPKASPELPPTAAQKPAPSSAAPAPASEQPENRKAASSEDERATAPAQGSLNRSRDASDVRESAAAAPPAAPAPSPFPASPPAAASAAPAAPAAAAPPRVMMAPAPAPAPAAPSLQRSESLATQRAPPSARGFANAPTSLLQAARSGSTADIAQLVQQGAALNAPDETGRTPLMLAVINGHEAVVRQLLSLGANRALVDREGLTALDHARRLGLPDITAVLEASR